MPFLKKIHLIIKNNHFQSLLGNGVMALFGILTLSILYHALSLFDMGIYVFFITIIGLVDTLKTGFLTNGYIKFYSGTNLKRSKEVAGSAWYLAILITLFLILINLISYFISFYYHNEGMNLFNSYFWLITLSTLPSFMANLSVQADGKFDRLLWLRLINQLIFVVGIILLILFKKSTLIAIVYIQIFSNSITSIATLAFGWTKIRTLFYSTKATVFELFHFGKYSMGTSLSSNLFKVTDTFFINFFLGPSGLALYNLGGRLVQIFEIPMLSLAASGMPILAAHYNNCRQEEMLFFMKKIIGMLTIVFVVLAILSVIFADPIISLIGGSKYIHTAAPNLFRIFISIAIFYPTERFLALVLDVVHKPKINFYKILIMLGINLIADYIGVILFKSVYAVVITNIFPVFAGILIAYYSLKKDLRFNFIDIYKTGYEEILFFIKKTGENLNPFKARFLN